jgi:serine/threonine-protein kinase HipA
MTSECFVYITLPNQTEAVVAGRFELSERRDVQTGRFVYARSYLERPHAVELDPVELTALDSKTYERAGENPYFPALRDAAPDAWGRRVIDRILGGQPTEIEYLLNSPDDRAGALAFGNGPKPPAPQRKFNKTLQLGELIDAADALLANEKPADIDVAKQVQQLHLLGTSMGGARPKAVVEDDDGLWLAKFPRPDDTFDQPRVEHAMLQLARSLGLDVASSKIEIVGERSVLFVKRFDRQKANDGYHRLRMVSGLTVLEASDSVTDRARWSYPLLADQLRRFDVVEAASRRELFKRMVLNALISNADDHPRNHAMIADANGWRLSPAYDLTPTPQLAQFDRRLAMTIGENGRFSTAKNLASMASTFGLAQTEALEVIADLRMAVSATWYATCRDAGVSEGDCGVIAAAFDYEGFDPDAVLGAHAPTP